MIITALTTSLIFHILLIWYARKLLQKLAYFSEDIGDMNENVEVFAEHLEKLHSLETYYGDQDLQNLIAHAKATAQEMREFKNLYLIGEVEEGNLEDAEEEEQEIE